MHVELTTELNLCLDSGVSYLFYQYSPEPLPYGLSIDSFRLKLEVDATKMTTDYTFPNFKNLPRKLKPQKSLSVVVVGEGGGGMSWGGRGDVKQSPCDEVCKRKESALPGLELSLNVN